MFSRYLRLFIVVALVILALSTLGLASDQDNNNDILSFNSGVEPLWETEEIVEEDQAHLSLDHLPLNSDGVDVLNFGEIDTMSDAQFITLLRKLYSKLSLDKQEGSQETEPRQIQAISLAPSHPVSVCAFNIQVFGTKKMSNPLVVQALVTILRQYDICLIQEIRDASDTAIWELLENINDPSYMSFGGGTINPNSKMYKLTVSERLGRTSSKEQYAFLFNTEVATLLETYQYEDKEDDFERPPYSAVFNIQAPGSASPTMYFFTGVHITPQDAASEIDKLVDVYDTMLNDKKLSSVARGALLERWVMMGDFNADCRYLPKNKFNSIRLWTEPRFTWLINDIDTTVAPSHCTYDRIVVTTKLVQDGLYVHDSANAFNYRDAFVPDYLKTEDDVKAVSDHWPVYMQIIA